MFLVDTAQQTEVSLAEGSDVVPQQDENISASPSPPLSPELVLTSIEEEPAEVIEVKIEFIFSMGSLLLLTRKLSAAQTSRNTGASISHQSIRTHQCVCSVCFESHW